MSPTLLLIFLGLGVGLISSILGLGGGILIVPLLSLVLDIPHKEVIATSLATIFLVASTNTFFFHKKGLVNWRAALAMGPATAVGALLGASLAFYFSELYLKSLLLFILVTFIFKTLFKEKWDQMVMGGSSDHWTVFVLWGALAGVVSGLTGIGSGVIIVPVLLGFSFMENQKVAPTANAVMVFTTITGVLCYAWGDYNPETYQLGFVHFKVAGLLFISAFSIAFIGRKYQHLLSSHKRSLILGALLCFLSFRILTQILNG